MKAEDEFPFRPAQTKRISPEIAAELASLDVDLTADAVISKEKRAEAHALSYKGGSVFERDGLSVSVDGLEQVDGGIKFDVVVMQDGVDVTPPDLNPVTIVNPPLGVRISESEVDIDPSAALQEVVADLLRHRGLV